MFNKTILVSIFFLFSFSIVAQTGEIRGFVYDKETGEPIIFTNVIIKELMLGKSTDANGFYSLSKVKPGTYTLMCFSLGYDTTFAKINLAQGRIVTQNLYLVSKKFELNTIEIKADRQKVKENVNISTNVITQKELKQLPTFGGEPDLVQYLQVLPGVNFSGDQGGQLYVRGGPPVMNKVMIDGMIIYNPFHSIGLFSVFDADIIRNADVSTGGFNAQYGGRISGIIDVTTREGDKKRFSGKVAVNPITAKILLEGPLRKFTEDGGSASYVLSYKTSYLDKTSKSLYSYADAVNGLPYSFNDIYGKISNISPNGSRINLFGFRFTDNTNFPSNQYSWVSNGFGGNMLVIPDGSNTLINANLGYSNYKMDQKTADNLPRESSISSFNASINFTNFIGKDDVKYGFEAIGFSTNYNYTNAYGRILSQDDYSSEIHTFFKYRKVWNRLVVEPGLRAIYYASLTEGSFEPRLGMKYNLTSAIRLKLAAGTYSQNLMSATSDQDVVNLFYGFLSSPDRVNSDIRRQKAQHLVVGTEIDLGRDIEINIEGFVKNFTQITNINRDKLYDDNQANQYLDYYLRGDVIKETGKAYGGDARLKYEHKSIYFWAVYSLTFVTRNDGRRDYTPSFDRRHNINLVFSYTFGDRKSWSVNSRWNFGSGFPFTQTQGFYENVNFNGGVGTNVNNQNGNLGIYFTDINTGRLPYFHRLDASISKKYKLSKHQSMSFTLSATNVYNRDNIFYFDRLNYKRINQLPIMPTLGFNYTF
ncbi:MAG: TonB-dependent receptor [Bacteroidia bacterium]|nr:TonB-dependent receptor [Bacteroidia bacterium]MCF8426183.1 TonB-dependent receptor [Bacteroidia bacterium]MCF8445531.1 TonB-dependent receptor [Bacteroidia bacterium]